MRTVSVLVAFAVLCTAAAAAAAAPAETPGAFITRIVKEDLRGQWGLEWRELHPGHRTLITQKQYVACSRGLGTAKATGREIFQVVSVRDDAIDVRGVPQHKAKLVTLSFREPGKKATRTTLHLHAVAVGGHWTWILGNAFLDKLAHGRCLDGARLEP